MTYQEKCFASTHDWFIASTSTGVIVRCDMEAGKTLTFTNLKDLLNWAGY